MIHGYPERNPLEPGITGDFQREGYRVENRTRKTAPLLEPADQLNSIFEHSMPGQVLLMLGEDLTHYRIWDDMRAIDYLLSRPERRLSWRDTARAFQTSWEAVYRSVEWFVEWGLAHPPQGGVESIWVDEIHWGRGLRADNFLTVIYQIDAHRRRLLWVGPRRSQATLRRGLKALGPEVVQGLEDLLEVPSARGGQLAGEQTAGTRINPQILLRRAFFFGAGAAWRQQERPIRGRAKGGGAQRMMWGLTRGGGCIFLGSGLQNGNSRSIL
jgi:hypothetical protein